MLESSTEGKEQLRMSEQTKAAPASDAWTVLRLLQWTTDFFRKRGSDSPRLDAEVLLAHVLGCSRIELYTAFGTEPSAPQRELFRDMVRKRGDGAPVAYLVGYREFYSLRLKVSPAVLIPRPETEHVVIEALDHTKRLGGVEPERGLRIADVGTGSGAIAIAVAKHLPAVHAPGCEITAIDISSEALTIARENVEQLEVADRVTLIQGDLLSPLPTERSLHLVLSNPPYVSESEYSELAPEVREHEPRSALVSGPNGTEIIERLIAEASARLVPGGQLIIELSPMIATACAEAAIANGNFAEPKLIKDLSGHRRILSATRSA
jgi:release factor glutamine methyltransferase